MSNLRAHLALLFANIMYGINYTVAKGVMPDYIEPLGFILTRAIGATALFWIIHAAYPTQKVDRRDLVRMAVCGLFGVALNQSLFFLGLNITTPINASIIMTTNPILVLLASAVMLKERLSLKKWLGIALGITGALMVITMGSSISFGSDTALGDLMVFLNATSYGIYLVMVAPLMKKYSPLTVIKWVFLFGMFYVVPFGSVDFLEVNWLQFPSGIWWSVLFVVVCVSFLTYLLNVYAMKKVTPTVASIYIYTQPVFASLVAIVFGKDSLDAIKIIATVLIFTGVYLVSIQSKGVTAKVDK